MPIEIGLEYMQLTNLQKDYREILVQVATESRRIGYKELWSEITDEIWGQIKTQQIVENIAPLARYELNNGRPPLNVIVTPKSKNMPSEPWHSMAESFRDHGTPMPYTSYETAQEHCWSFWGNKAKKHLGKSTLEIIRLVENAHEGYMQERTTSFRYRNRQIVKKRKRLDNYTCQACGFHLMTESGYVIDCHHLKPLNSQDDNRITSIHDLVCLCPTCHRIAHSSSPPLSIESIKYKLKNEFCFMSP